MKRQHFLAAVLVGSGLIFLLTTLLLLMPGEFLTASALVAFLSAVKIKALTVFEVFLRERLWQGVVVAFWKSLTLKKAALLTSIGLGKRFVVDVVVMGQIKRHYLEKIQEPVAELITHLKASWKRWSPLKKVLSILPASVAGYLVHALGFSGTLLKNTLTAKFWSHLLLLIMKLWAAIGLFVTEVFIHSWLTPFIEVFFISIILKQLKRIPFVYELMERFWNGFAGLIRRLADLMRKAVKGNIEKSMGLGAKKTTEMIHRITRDKEGRLKMEKEEASSES